ncbi:glycosyltransferase family 2 protein [Pelagicoccus mobilis]|uniref:Glycosyltransferase family 2 protein n=1 Tax=Pelagicoccus mobilis TaxID=415221 RepID=A0A934S029_9BACT|nr:glycosyltransferase family 2 protein [Pelagicoccus mobilis]MBK1876633.1 glycosyltransferase family 2 protein [Pelagicoccus mobilis]
MNCTITVIICSRDNTASLSKTLENISSLRVSPGCEAELLIIDNSSEPLYETLVRDFKSEELNVRCVHEPKPGLSVARNTGLRNSTSDIIVFTDDDVAPEADWLCNLTGPIRLGAADAARGRITLAPHLIRPWMTETHFHWLASPTSDSPNNKWLIGASMAFHRRVLQKVPQFDESLGAGALGFCEEQLFAMQLVEAGYTIHLAENAQAIHYPDLSRLDRNKWIDQAIRRGASVAYLEHHWLHKRYTFSRLRQLYAHLKLILRSSITSVNRRGDASCPEWEMSYHVQINKLKSYTSIKNQTRRYNLRGLSQLR